jgi:hypothetical protein
MLKDKAQSQEEAMREITNVSYNDISHREAYNEDLYAKSQNLMLKIWY